MGETRAFQLTARKYRRLKITNRKDRLSPLPQAGNSLICSLSKRVRGRQLLPPQCSASAPSLPFSAPSPLFLANADDVFSNADIAWGLLMAVILGGLGAFLQENRKVKEPKVSIFDKSLATTTTTVRAAPTDGNQEDAAGINTTETTTFDGWVEMSKPDKYIWYNTNLRNRRQAKSKESKSYSVEQRWVLFALLLLFTPIFSFEFFLAVSRQLVCNLDWTKDWCTPYQF